ncbi:hypothetical protein [Leifsonia sp. NPDC077715]|uniref:hypothetical protein n=1 Tax=Leifsonia sp. NPDC077715 TaxID=3155539 RepID=UPI0034277AA0
MIRTSRSSRSSSADPSEALRVAVQLAKAEGWEADPSCRPAGVSTEGRVVVTGAVSGRRCLLRVRERRGAEPVDAAAREGAASEHVVGVVRRLGGRRNRGREWEAVLLSYPEGGDLSRRLTRDCGLRGGEAATVLLGIADGLAALHRAGWARPGLSPSGIAFAADGCPALDELDGVVPFDPDAAVADAEAYFALARTVCLRVTDGTGMTLLGAVERGLRQGTWEHVEASVSAAVAPEPVRLPELESGGVAAGTIPREAARRLGVRDAVVSAMAFLDGEPARTVGRRLGMWARRRPAVVAAGSVPLVAAVALVALLPAAPAESAGATGAPEESAQGASSRQPRPAGATAASGAGRTAPTSTPAAPSDATSGRTDAAGGQNASVPSPESGSAVSTAVPAPEPGGREAADPVVAAAAVLAARHACFAERRASPACLAGVLDAEPAFVAQETDALTRSGAADERDFTGASLSLLERWGDAALIAAAPDAARTPKSEPASLLLVRSEAGWRLRAVYP